MKKFIPKNIMQLTNKRKLSSLHLHLLLPTRSNTLTPLNLPRSVSLQLTFLNKTRNSSLSLINIISTNSKVNNNIPLTPLSTSLLSVILTLSSLKLRRKWVISKWVRILESINWLNSSLCNNSSTLKLKLQRVKASRYLE